MRIFKTLTYIALITIPTLFSCKKDETKSVNHEFFTDIKPDNWDCEFLEAEEKFLYVPQITDSPAFIVRYIRYDTNFLANGRRIHPQIYLNVYPYQQREFLDVIISSQQQITGCIPLFYAEINPFYFVTSPCFINENYYSIETNKILNPIHTAFKDAVSRFNSNFYVDPE